MIDTTTVADLFTRWDIPWVVTSELAVVAFVYVRGWRRIRRTRPAQFPPWRLAAFLGGIVALFVAVASPLDTFSESLLFMHMAQHLVLMSVAPPLIVSRRAGGSHAARPAAMVHPHVAPAFRDRRASRGGTLPHASSRRLARHERRLCRLAHSTQPTSLRSPRKIGTTSSTPASFLPISCSGGRSSGHGRAALHNRAGF